MKILNPESAQEIFRRYYALLKYFKRVLVTVPLASFPHKNFFFSLRNLKSLLPSSIVSNAILSFKSRVEFIQRATGFSFPEAVKVVNVKKLSRNILVPHWDIIFLDKGLSVKCPDGVIFLRTEKPLVNASLILLKQTKFSEFELKVLRTHNQRSLSA